MVHQLFSDPWFLWNVSAPHNQNEKEIQHVNFLSRPKIQNLADCLFFKTVLTLYFLLEHVSVVLTQHNSN